MRAEAPDLCDLQGVVSLLPGVQPNTQYVGITNLNCKMLQHRRRFLDFKKTNSRSRVAASASPFCMPKPAETPRAPRAILSD